MDSTQRLAALSGLSLSLFAFGAKAQEDPTIVILPDPASDRADAVTANIVLPDDAADGQATARANDADAETNAAEGLTEAQANAAEAAEHGLQTALDAVDGARGDLGRANIPESLPEQVPTDLPAVPGDSVPDDVDLPTPPAPPTPPFGGG